MYPFLNISTVTDADLLMRMSALKKHLSAETQQGHDRAVENLKVLLKSLEFEYQERMKKQIEAKTLAQLAAKQKMSKKSALADNRAPNTNLHGAGVTHTFGELEE